MAITREIWLWTCGQTDRGLEREHNEDAFIIADLESGVRSGESAPPQVMTVGPRGILLAVCDGMGGAQAGEVASALATEIAFSDLKSAPGAADELVLTGQVEQALLNANTQIWQAAEADTRKAGMGTTASVVAFVGSTLVIGQVGDSRVYLARKGKLQQVTKDQSLVEALIESGTIDKAEAKQFQYSNVILQALGVEPDVTPEMQRLPVYAGDLLLICSDGLHGPVSDERASELVSSALADIATKEGTAVGAALEVLAKQLIDEAKARGAPDNVTVVLGLFAGAGLTASESSDLAIESVPHSAPREPTKRKSHPALHGMGSAHDGFGDESDPSWELVRQERPSAGARSTEPVSHPEGLVVSDVFWVSGIVAVSAAIALLSRFVGG